MVGSVKKRRVFEVTDADIKEDGETTSAADPNIRWEVNSQSPRNVTSTADGMSKIFQSPRCS